MKLPDFERLREGQAPCPSALALDRLVAGELTDAARSETEAHLVACADCAGRVAHLRAGFDAMEGVDPRALLAGVRRRLDDEPARTGWRAFLARWLGDGRLPWAPLAAAGAALVVLLVVLPRSGPDDPDGSVRRKGGLALHVHRLAVDRATNPIAGSGGAEASSEEVLSGDRFRPGDRLRFVVDLPRDGHVAIVGVDADGGLYEAWPLGGGAVDTLRSAGRRQVLPGAVSLDDKPGRETLYLVHCAPEVGPPRCTSRGVDAAPVCPATCALSPFVVDKEP